MPSTPFGLSLSKASPSLPASEKQGGLRQAQPERLWVLLFGFLLTLLATPALAQTFPALSGRVVDSANLLSPEQEAALTAKLAALETSTTRQLVVATVPDLQGYPIEDYGYRLGRDWKIGQKGENNGVILLVAPTERKVRVEVGYGLEPFVTDALAATIVRDQILPRFRANDFPGGIEAGVDALLAQLQLPADQAQTRQGQILERQQAQPREKRSGGIPFGLIFWGMVAAFVFLSMRRGRKQKGMFGSRRYSRGSNLPVWLWVASEVAQSAASSGGGGFGGGGGFSGGGGSFGGGGASGGW